MLVKVQHVLRDTADAVTIRLDDSAQPIAYLPGQYLILHAQVDGRPVSRAYSFCTSPYLDRYPAITVKRVPGGLLSNHLVDHVRAGDHLEVEGPSGNFTTTFSSGNRRRLLLFAGGSGITPLLSLARSALVREPRTRVTLVYANRRPEGILFRDTLETMQAAWPDRFTAVHVLEEGPAPTGEGARRDAPHRTGRLTAQVVGELADFYSQPRDPAAEYFVCGPGPMMELVVGALLGQGVSPDQIHQERFSSDPLPDQGKPTPGPARTVRVRRGGGEHPVAVRPDQSILDAALDAGFALPYSCRDAFCGACAVRLVGGRVRLGKNYALTEEELAAGKVLTCVGHPEDDDVVVEVPR